MEEGGNGAIREFPARKPAGLKGYETIRATESRQRAVPLRAIAAIGGGRDRSGGYWPTIALH